MTGGYAGNDRDRYEPPACLRCGRRPDVEWRGIRVFSEAETRRHAVLLLCQTPGCVDGRGSNRVPMR